MEQIWKVTAKLGNHTRKFVLFDGPIPKKGDVITIKGQGAEWTVSKVEKDTAITTVTMQPARLEQTWPPPRPARKSQFRSIRGDDLLFPQRPFME